MTAQRKMFSEASAKKAAAADTEIKLYPADTFISDFDITLVNPDPDQPRSEVVDDLEFAALTASILKQGVQYPILCRQDDDGTVFIIGGERRYYASLKAGHTTIPVIFKTGNTTEIAITDNLLRSDYTPVEMAEALKRLQDEFKYKNTDIAELIGKAEPTVSEILSLNRLSEDIKKVIRHSKTFTRADLLKVVGKKTEYKTEAVKLVSEAQMMGRFIALKSKVDAQKAAEADKAAGVAPAENKPADKTDAFQKATDAFIAKLTAADFATMDTGKLEVLTTSLQALSALITSKLSK